MALKNYMLFEDLNIIKPILEALKDEGFTTPTPIQTQAIPLILEKRDILGCAQTGTGKTAAFAIPIIQLLQSDKKRTSPKRDIKCLILTPTRELAIQIGESFQSYGRNLNLKSKVIFGGVSSSTQVEALKTGVEIVIATPGRLLDLMGQNLVDLKNLQFFVLDEADRMLDMGFVQDVKKIIKHLPVKRQTLFFSATMPPAITELSKSILVNPAKIEVSRISSTATTINQVVYFVDKANKKNLLIEVLKDDKIERALVFTRTKHGADRVAKDLYKFGITAQAIHGDKSQNNRQKALNNFKSKELRILVATDIAARGIDIDELTHVINFELPNIPESYVHRIGRTGRAGASGIAIAFCDVDEKEYLKDIQKLIKLQIPEITDHGFPAQNSVPTKPETKSGNSRGSQVSRSPFPSRAPIPQKSNNSRPINNQNQKSFSQRRRGP